MEQQKTIVTHLAGNIPGFIVVAPLQAQTQQAIHHLQQQLAAQLPSGTLWLPQGEQLHITFMHFISPDRECVYDEDRRMLFSKLKPDILHAMSQAIPQQLDIALTIERIGASAPAIFIKWQDDGTYAALRQKVTQLVPLPAPTKRPPEIVHTTIARFRKAIDFAQVQQAVEKLPVSNLTEHTTRLHLVEEQKIFMQQHKILAVFPDSAA